MTSSTQQMTQQQLTTTGRLTVTVRWTTRIYKRMIDGVFAESRSDFVDLARATQYVGGSQVAAPDEITQLIGDALSDFRFDKVPADEVAFKVAVGLFLSELPGIDGSTLTVKQGKRTFARDLRTSPGGQPIWHYEN